jgi:hypothetical protein
VSLMKSGNIVTASSTLIASDIFLDSGHGKPKRAPEGGPPAGAWCNLPGPDGRIQRIDGVVNCHD